MIHFKVKLGPKSPDTNETESWSVSDGLEYNLEIFILFYVYFLNSSWLPLTLESILNNCMVVILKDLLWEKYQIPGIDSFIVLSVGGHSSMG